jgi:hypothetical protein
MYQELLLAESRVLVSARAAGGDAEQAARSARAGFLVPSICPALSLVTPTDELPWWLLAHASDLLHVRVVTSEGNQLQHGPGSRLFSSWAVAGSAATNISIPKRLSLAAKRRLQCASATTSHLSAW